MKTQATITLVQFTANDESTVVLKRMRGYFEQAKEQRSDLIAFPEYSLGSRIPFSHDNIQGFLHLAKEYAIYAVSGFVDPWQPVGNDSPYG